ncbi:unnamed protein product [Caenorhabditis sp. 36 PRJEB53466]|nr:unnamed protein product [Caenorhabditis sp. 36 PRJEB53466]
MGDSTAIPDVLNRIEGTLEFLLEQSKTTKRTAVRFSCPSPPPPSYLKRNASGEPSSSKVHRESRHQSESAENEPESDGYLGSGESSASPPQGPKIADGKRKEKIFLRFFPRKPSPLKKPPGQGNRNIELVEVNNKETQQLKRPREGDEETVGSKRKRRDDEDVEGS